MTAKAEPNKSKYNFTNLEVVLISLGLVGFMQLVMSLGDQLTPLWIEADEVVNAYIPLFAHISNNLLAFFNNSIFMLFVVYLINNLTNYATKKKYLYYMLSIIFMICYAGSSLGTNAGIDSFSSWIIVGLVYSILFIYLYLSYFRHDISVIPLVVSFVQSISLIGISLTNLLKYGITVAT